MYTLRKVTSDGVEINLNLGEQYTVIKNEISPKAFRKAYNEVIIGNEAIFFSDKQDITGDLNYDKTNFWLDVPIALEKGFKYIQVEGSTYVIKNENQVSSAFSETEDRVYAFVLTEEGKAYPLYQRDLSFIMTDTGKTFSNLSIKQK